MSSEQSKAQGELTTIRDTVESIWVAIIVAFVLRAFVIEAFVIPTGSMAPRLMGEHFDLQCPACGYEFAFGPRSEDVAHGRSGSAQCPNCDRPLGTVRELLNGGDKVLVLKYLYHFAEPQPWDVVVFRNPQDNRQNYIKRLIGLPGETIEIIHGDVFVRRGSLPWEIRRKPPRVQDVMWQVIYDNDYRPDPQWQRDSSCPKWLPTGCWDANGDQGRRFDFCGSGKATLAFDAGQKGFYPRYGYNTPRDEDSSIENNIDVCSDLKLLVVVKPSQKPSEVGLEMTSFEDRFTARVSTDGNAALSCQAPDPNEQWTLTGNIGSMTPGQGRELSLTHVDFRTTLWVDGKAVLSHDDIHFPSDYEWLSARIDTKDDLRSGGLPPRPIPMPEVKVWADQGPCQLLHLKLWRDAYYTSNRLDPMARDKDGSLDRAARDREGNPLWPAWEYANAINLKHKQDPEFRDPRYRACEYGYRGWATRGIPIELAEHAQNRDLDEFFVLGDNSPQSLDGRCWTRAAPSLRLYDEHGDFQYQLGTVPRYNLIGKAFFVYWPAAFRIPMLPSLPIIPNVGRMRLIR